MTGPRHKRELIRGEGALAGFRRGLSGPRALELLEEAQGRLLVQLPVGAGKTHLLTQIIEHIHTDPRFDLTLVLLPRWDVGNEVLSRLSPQLEPTVLRPRPQDQCGNLDNDWKTYEACGCGLLGRQTLCMRCPRQLECRWPSQYGKNLRGVKLVVTTQQHLMINPYFVRQIQNDTKAARPLLLLDESALLLKAVDRTICRTDIERFTQAIEEASHRIDSNRAYANRWLTRTQLIVVASQKDLQDGNWTFPSVKPEWAVSVQRAGWERFGEEFRFLGYDLQNFACSDRASRVKPDSGDIRFATPPSLGEKFIIFSGTIAKELARYRLDPSHRGSPISSPFAHLEFSHPGTRWYNIRSTSGAACNFPGNASGILDFFAARIAQNIRDCKRTLLVARKQFLPLCSQQLTEKLREHGSEVRVITEDWARVDLTDPCNLPLINYGVCGINLFEGYDGAYCLTGFYVSQATVTTTVHDISATPDQYPISIRTEGIPPSRCAKVQGLGDRVSILPVVAQGVLDQLEADTVVQAVGRVRPFTRPREIITYHAGDLPGVQYTLDFRNLAAARAYFGIVTSRVRRRESRVEEARRLHQEGFSHTQIAAEMGISARTIRRYTQFGGRTRSII